MSYLEVPCYSKSCFKIEIKRVLHQQRSRYQEIMICDTFDFGRCLVLDGDIQCSEYDHHVYDTKMLWKLKRTDNRVLILGGGDGYVTEMALKMNPCLEITLVELDREVINACRSYLGQNIYENEKVKIIEGNAVSFMNATKEKNYNGIVYDLTDAPLGNEEEKKEGFYETILERSKEFLTPGGWIGAYTGSNAVLLHSQFKKTFADIECGEAFVSSFGETCPFIYGTKA